MAGASSDNKMPTQAALPQITKEKPKKDDISRKTEREIMLKRQTIQNSFSSNESPRRERKRMELKASKSPSLFEEIPFAKPNQLAPATSSHKEMTTQAALQPQITIDFTKNLNMVDISKKKLQVIVPE